MPGEEAPAPGSASSFGYFAGLAALTVSSGVLAACLVYAVYHYVSSGEQIVRLLLK